MIGDAYTRSHTGLYAVAFADSDKSARETVTVWVPAAAGGVYRPVAEMVPVAAAPPVLPSTCQMTLGLLAVNCWVRVEVSVVTRGLITRPLETVALAEFEKELGFPDVSTACTR